MTTVLDVILGLLYELVYEMLDGISGLLNELVDGIWDVIFVYI